MLITTVSSPLSMPLRHRVLLIAAVAFAHLILLFNYHRDIPLAGVHKEMSVSFSLRDNTPTTETHTPTAKLSIPHEFKQATVSKLESESSYSIVSSEAVPTSITETTSVQATTSSLPDNEPDYLAAYLNNSAPIYPVVARRLGWQGKVLVSVKVLADGRAGQVKLQHSSGHPVLDDAAINAVKDWHFSPARHAGQPVDKWFLVPIPFVLKESE